MPAPYYTEHVIIIRGLIVLPVTNDAIKVRESWVFLGIWFLKLHANKYNSMLGYNLDVKK